MASPGPGQFVNIQLLRNHWMDAYTEVADALKDAAMEGLAAYIPRRIQPGSIGGS